MNLSKILRNTMLYFLLLVGYVFMYVIDIEGYFYEKPETESTSKIKFIYQQF